MKRRSIIFIAAGFVIALSCSWFAKPRSIMQELSLAGIKLDRDEVIERGFLTHFYVGPFAKDPVITNIFKQAGFDEMPDQAPAPHKVQYFEKVNRVLFWKGHEYLTIEKKADHLEIVVAERR